MLCQAILATALLRCAIAAILLVASLARAQAQRAELEGRREVPVELEAPARIRPLEVDARRDVPLAAGAGLLAAGLSSSYAAPGRCRYCGSGRVDDWARDRLLWGDPRPARLASDVLASGVLPAAALLNSAIFARLGGDPRAFWEDALVIAEAAALTASLNGAAKDATARRRPSAGLTATGSANRSFFSGHTSFAFTVAAAAGTVSSLRGYPSAPWVWAGGMTLASAVGYLRVAGDAHWASDVVAGAAIGGLLGAGVPWLFHRPGRRAAGYEVVPAPGGFGVVF